MCGICGIINFDGHRPMPERIMAMMSAMNHRGPDDQGMFIDHNIGLGHVRLSIIDLSSAGHQPMFSSDERYVIVYNGEIFNYLELRDQLTAFGYRFATKTDTEVLLSAYQHWGEDCQNRFNGMWAFVIYDRKEKKVFASRDRYGIKPFYYFQENSFFAFASEIPPLLTLLPGKPAPDNQSIFDYLVFNRTDHTERTFFHEIKKLQHGHVIKIQCEPAKRPNFSIEKWYDLRDHVNRCSGFASPQEFRELFSSAVGLRLRSDVPVGVCLSGGLDSSSIVSVLLADYRKEDLHTFSAVYEPGQHEDESHFIDLFKPEVNNMHFIRPSAQSLLNDLHDFIRAHAEPIPSTSPYAQFKVMELAKDHIVVTLDGQGADEELAGYHYFFGFYFKELLVGLKISRLLYEMLHYSLKHKSAYAYKSFLYFLLPQYFRTRLEANKNGYISAALYHEYAPKTTTVGELYGSNGLQDALLNHFEYKLEHLLKWEDRNSMWFSLEARVPFLDHRLVEKIIAIRSDLVINRGMTKNILRQAMQGTLPASICNRIDKIGFATPQDQWFRTPDFKKYISELIKSQSFKVKKIWDVDSIQRMYKAHLSGTANHSNEIWKWIHLENWFQTFIH